MLITLRAPAKINLHLRVFPRGSDGFHPLRSWFRTVELFDELRIEEMQEQSEDPLGLQIHCTDPAVPLKGNLIAKARFVFQHADPKVLNPAMRVVLTKLIPVGAGLGGGSSDAAAMLAAEHRMRQEWREPYNRELLHKLALAVGADVPFFLRHQLEGISDATCTGRGEIVQPFAPGRRHVVLLILPDLQVSTAAAYSRFDELPAPPPDDTPDFSAWSQLPATELLTLLRNDLEAASFALQPQLAKLYEQAQALLDRPVRMTGSGSALFSLYDDRDDAAEALARLAPLGVRQMLA